MVVKKPSGWDFWVEERQDKAKKEEEVPIEKGPRVWRTGPPRSGGSKGQGVNVHQATSPYMGSLIFSLVESHHCNGELSKTACQPQKNISRTMKDISPPVAEFFSLGESRSI